MLMLIGDVAFLSNVHHCFLLMGPIECITCPLNFSSLPLRQAESATGRQHTHVFLFLLWKHCCGNQTKNYLNQSNFGCNRPNPEGKKINKGKELKKATLVFYHTYMFIQCLILLFMSCVLNLYCSPETEIPESQWVQDYRQMTAGLSMVWHYYGTWSLKHTITIMLKIIFQYCTI